MAAPPLDSPCDLSRGHQDTRKILKRKIYFLIFILTGINNPSVNAVKQVPDFKPPIILYIIKL